MRRNPRPQTSAVVATLLAVGTALLLPSASHAKGSNAGSLGAGGRVRGDISRDQGEEDRITVDLDQGATVSIHFSASFHAALLLTDPDGAPVDLGGTGGTRLQVTDHPVERSGTYQFVVSSGDGSQGVYTLLVKQRWDRTQSITGSGRQVVDVAMPAGAKITGAVHGARGVAGHPEILGLEDPTGSALLQSPIVGPRGTAKLPPTPTAQAGTYHLTVDTTDDTSAWTGVVTRLVPKASSAPLVLTNGIDAVSFSGDGVGFVFARRCGSCHDWAHSYGGVRGEASAAFFRLRSGSMPPGNPLPATEVGLISSWVKTGRKP